MILNMIASLFLIVAIICFLNLTPKTIADDLLILTTPKESIREKAHALRTGKKKKSLGQRLIYTQDALQAMGKGSQFALVVCTSLILMAAGAVIGVLINNIFLIPALVAFLAIVPFVYVRNSLTRYEKHIKDELETTLSIITTSYCRSDNIIAAVKENIPYIRPPLKENFSAFVTDATLVTNTVQALKNLKSKVEDDIFAEWCDALIQCEADSTMKETLQPIVSKLTDAKQVGSDIHITPHMFRHTIATLLLEEDVDIRYIQELLGHSSITTTQIYTHISMNAQKKILSKKHPRNKMKINVSP